MEHTSIKERSSILPAAILLAYALFIIFLLATDNLSNYLNPRWNILIILTSISLLFFATLFLIKTKWVTSQSSLSILIWILPLFLLIILPPQVKSSVESEMAKEFANPLIFTDFTYYTERPSQKSGEKHTISTENFTQDIQILRSQAKNFEGDTLTISGFILKPGEPADGQLFLDGQMFIGRLYLWHCYADAQSIGIDAVTSDLEYLVDGGWYELEGKIIVYDTGNMQMPVLQVERYSRKDTDSIFVYN